MKKLESSISDHFKPMQSLKKLPKSIIHDEALFSERLACLSEEITEVAKLLEGRRVKIKEKNRFLMLADVISIIEVEIGLFLRGPDSMLKLTGSCWFQSWNSDLILMIA